MSGCDGCAAFRTAPADLTAALPGLESLSSAYASVRGGDGLCATHGILLNGRRRCADYRPAASLTG